MGKTLELNRRVLLPLRWTDQLTKVGALLGPANPSLRVKTVVPDWWERLTTHRIV
jgi:hypothetical protein